MKHNTGLKWVNIPFLSLFRRFSRFSHYSLFSQPLRDQRWSQPWNNQLAISNTKVLAWDSSFLAYTQVLLKTNLICESIDFVSKYLHVHFHVHSLAAKPRKMWAGNIPKYWISQKMRKIISTNMAHAKYLVVALITISII